MSTSGISRQCPRCGTLLFEEMPFCRACGWQFAPPAAAPSSLPASEFIPYDGPGGPESWPIEQPGFPFQNQPGYLSPTQISYLPPTQQGWPPAVPGYYLPPGQAGPVGYAPAPGIRRPAWRGKTLLLIALALIVLAGAAGGIFLTLRGGASTTTTPFDRHGLQNNVPLPDNIAFQYKHTVTQGALTADEWIWKVNKGEPAAIAQFYKDRLPRNGWTHIQTIQGDTLGVVGCQGSQVLVVGISKHLHDSNGGGTPTTTDAPAGGSALGIALTANQELRQDFCARP
jgi:hypothetical protein